MKDVWDVVPPKQLKREQHERARMLELFGRFETYGSINDKLAVLFVVDKKHPERSRFIAEDL